ncbi:HpcH/HpaI aldolase/citrate lyase family protein [Kitasatospora viridis]|uniref:Citrate lyase beta subunit n=1 Tax=Kitasatospora viridis TaxID=281105 RepID=A0A561ULH0_9ACTN|nr:HpcH/HpaI aldolase/citrate lyase family protein [Kitasatospora viridis]TWG00226.1 citrate lyase beta subunit [Kitasatospora viridis]
MRHFGQLDAAVRRRLFHREPEPVDPRGDPAALAAALGGTLYCPADRAGLAADVRRQAARGAVSMVLCLEDAVADAELPAAEDNLVAQLTALAREAAAEQLPLLFVRVRTPEQIGELTRRLGPAAELLSGYVLPKFTEAVGARYLEQLAEAAELTGRRLYGMPVLESPELAHLERRRTELLAVAELLAKHRERVLAVRLGVTDLCAGYGLRRPPGLTAYDLAVVAAVIGDVVNVLGRADGTGFTVTGPVWEYFPLQRWGPELAGLRRELELDLANGLLGKTCVHPSQLPVVHARLVVSHEEYSDARVILRREAGGVLASSYRNKMNEARPHRVWAERTLRRAAAFGVARAGVGFDELLPAVCGG